MTAVELEKEWKQVNEQFGRTGRFRQIRLSFTTQRFFEECKQLIKTDRWAEVAFAVERKNGKVIVIRSQHYPQGIYRIPTGGICYGEEITHALYREIREELGVTVEIKQFLGGIQYEFCYGEEHISYGSFVFYLKETGGTILEDAIEQEVSEYREVDAEELFHICRRMERHKESWQDWCRFRLQTTSFVRDYLEQRP